MLRFVFLSCISAIAIFVLLRVGSDFGWWALPTYLLEIVIVNLVIVLLFFCVAIIVAKPPSNNFVLVVLLMTAVRLLFLAIIIFVILRLDTTGAVANASAFLITYCIFMLIEVIELIRRIKVQ